MFQRGSTYIMTISNGWKVLMEGQFIFLTSKGQQLCDNSHSHHNPLGVYSEHAIPVDIADRFNASFPYHMSIGMSQRSTAKIAELDK